MNQSILNHLFLPHYLPSSADDDFLIENNHQNEYKILECMGEYFNSFESINATKSLPIFRILSDCIQRWTVLQNSQNISVSNLQSTIEQLAPGDFLPLYFHAQNAAILIEMDENNTSQPLISAWQALLPTVEITSSVVPHLSCFPVTTYRLANRSQLISKVQCELLKDFMDNPIEYSKSYKASRKMDEIRDVPKSHYVCQWWIQQFQGIQIENNPNRSCQFKKKHRDQIRWNSALLPFRRSGLWMTIKVVFQTILTKCLGYVGTIVYKLLITGFLTYIIGTRPSSIDLLVHCIRKLVRRLNKIESLPPFDGSNDVIKWVHHTKQEIQMKINEVFPERDWQKTIRTSEEQNNKFSMTDLGLNQPETYQHLCLELKTYINDQNSNKTSTSFAGINNYDDFANINPSDYIPSYDVLTQQLNYTTGIALTRMENWVELNLEQWMSSFPSLSIKVTSRFEILLSFYEKYQSEALKYYWSEFGSTDPIGYSRFILTSLTIIRVMHEKLCNELKFERLKLHSIYIPNLIELFEFLVLPNFEDMIRARNLYDYFRAFSVNVKLYPDLLSNIEYADAFGVYYATQSSTMINDIQRIRLQAKQDREDKITEVKNAQQKYMQLMEEANRCSCEYDERCKHKYFCRRCQLEQQAKAIGVKIFECPMPLIHESALAVIFELQMPLEIRCYRDILWQFINRPNPNPKTDMYEWLNVPPHAEKLGPFYTGPSNRKVKLVSSTKSVTQTHYSAVSVASASVDSFLYENSLKVQIPPNKPITIQDECRILTPQLDHPDYKSLQFTIGSTQFVQNQVIAKLSDCPSRLKPTQFVEFGSFRSGHCLQWWNLLTILEMDSLSIAEESVAILIIHSILQYGPLTSNSDAVSNHWCPESHKQLLEDHFVDELISRLNHHLDDCELNWQNELVLLVITMITMRILTICNHTREANVADLALKCRRTGEKWIDLISKSVQTISPSAFNEAEKLRFKMVNVGIACLLTFSTKKDRINYLLSSNEHVISLLKAATTVHDNIILNKSHSNMSTFMRNIMRFSEHMLVIVQPIIAEFLRNTSYQSLNEFAAIYWAVTKSKGNMNGQWKKRKGDIYDGWYDCYYESRCISIDCIKGVFLVDGMTVGFLPKTITSNELFVRVFENHIFEVQAAELTNTYITKYSYHGDGRVQYAFHFNDQNKRLIITERHLQTNEIFQLIPHSYFQTELPDSFISRHSHWINTNNQILEFRPISFKVPDFLDNKPYKLSLVTGYLTTTEIINAHTLVNQSSAFFQKMFNKYFSRLDDKPYVYMMRDDITIHIHLSQLGIAFKYNISDHIITSREYSDMYVEESQWLGTLTGLKSGLLLSPLLVNNRRLEHYPYRKFIVPFGEIQGANTSATHQIVTIRRASSTIQFSHQYFVFILNDRLKILQSTDSPTGWLYLALLHAMTSHPLPDEYTGMTGMERAFQLLNSAGCWSDQPFDSLSLNIIGQIAAISPKVNYYPKHLTCMEKIDWNSNGLSYSMQHFGYYLIARKLIDASKQLHFMFPSSVSNTMPGIFEEKVYNEKLLKKLYWDYRDSYNPTARLSATMETDIISTSSATPHCPDAGYCWNVTNYSPIHLVKGLYASGDINLRDCSNQHWLPLSQWLTNENELKSVWIGLLKLADHIKREAVENRADRIERFEKLLDFLHYSLNNCQSKPFYLQMLKTALKLPITSMSSVVFPQFIFYKDIEEVSFVSGSIDFEEDLTRRQTKKIIAEIKDCIQDDCEFEDSNDMLSEDDVEDINRLLINWRNNKKLRLFLNSVQTIICSVSIKHFHTKVTYYSQCFALELLTNHYQIQLKYTDKSIDRELLLSAEQRFHHSNANQFNKSTILIHTVDRQDAFPEIIFPSNNDQENPLSEITNYFKNQLDESWKKLRSDKQIQRTDPSVHEINEFLISLRKESIKSWNELVKSITLFNEQLFTTGLLPRITPTTLISLFQRKFAIYNLTTDQYTLLGGILVNWTLEQQLERAQHFAVHEKHEDLKKEMSNIPHSNWIPSEHVPWLILELEMNITIREIQIKVARHMMHPNMTTNDDTVKSIVMQMNMGEGKTSVILPMLALSLSSSSSLVRIIVLKSLFPTNYQSLRYKLGGLLNRRIFSFATRRDMNFNNGQIKQIQNRLEQGLCDCDVILTSSEDILSFDLLTIDKCRRNEFDTGRSMLSAQRWLKEYARDVLDESDEILHVKYQLIYTVGGQQQVDAGAERWKTIQSILQLAKKYAEDISNHFPEEVHYKTSKQKSAFPQFRLQSPHPFSLLCQKIGNDWTNNRSYRTAEKRIILSFILETNSSIEHILNKFPQNDIQLFLIVRGLLSSEVLLVALKKRHRVNYGVNPSQSFNRLMAVPFRAKDVAVDRTEFGHPDVALVLTQLSYYYSGLNSKQLTQCLNRLSQEETDPASIYDQWIRYAAGDDIPDSIRQWKGVNIKDYEQQTRYLFPTFQYNMLVINYFLNHFVYPREAKQFPYKLVSSAWDLSSSERSNIITGFSGTNDTQLLLPVGIRQYDLPELQKTDAIVVNNLLQSENESYQFLPINATFNEILKEITNYEEMINVILDVGALFIDGTNRDIAVAWLNLSDKKKIEYAIYFNSDSIFVCDRHSHHYRFETSPANERLDHCVFYLDEIHTRGTDFKFPKCFRAAVTLGNGLTKDRLVQACMRMRKLGHGHSLTFWSSYEVHQQIIRLKKNSTLIGLRKHAKTSIRLIDILRWVYENTVQSTWDGLHYWASQSLSFQRKIAAFRNIQWNDHQQAVTHTMMEELANGCLELEIIELIRMYGAPKKLQTVFEVHSARYQQTNHHMPSKIQEVVLKQLEDYGGTKVRLSQLLDEEQQRELEQELEEERQLARPPPVEPCRPILHEEIKKLCEINSDINLSKFPLVFQPLSYAFTGTTFDTICQPKSWQNTVWISTEFQRVIETKGESLNPFLRPPRWIIVYENHYIIFISALEANSVMARLNAQYYERKSKRRLITTLRLLLPRVKPGQSIFVNASNLTIPPTIKSLSGAGVAFTIPLEWLVQLFIFNGTLYFETIDEQRAYCCCLGLCPKERTKKEENAFDNWWIAVDGFVSQLEHRHYLAMNQVRFNSNPLTFVRQLMENRNNSQAPITSHVGSIILNSFKLI